MKTRLFLPFFLIVAVARMHGALAPAHVTVVIQDVRLLPTNAAARPAVVNDVVGQQTAVRTGANSRAELTFVDATITRLGANTIFSFNEKAREVELQKGAVLLQVRPGATGAKLSTPAVTASITGGTALLEYNPGWPIKFLVLEGTGQLCSRTTGDCATLHGGEMITASPDGKIGQPGTFNVQLVLDTSLLLTDFPPLPNLDLIQQVIIQQQNQPGGAPAPQQNSQAYLIDVITQNITANPSVTSPGATSTPGPPVISSPVPYVINNGTLIVTNSGGAPAIATNSGSARRFRSCKRRPNDFRQPERRAD